MDTLVKLKPADESSISSTVDKYVAVPHSILCETHTGHRRINIGAERHTM